jgi:hypothetical protein
VPESITSRLAGIHSGFARSRRPRMTEDFAPPASSEAKSMARKMQHC